jgi:hypothetical protein
MFSPSFYDKSLVRELDDTRNLVVSLMPKPAREVISRYKCAKTRQASVEWRNAAIDTIVAMAMPLALRYEEDRERAACPLCGSMGYSAVSADGFVIPTGLELHLRGRGKARLCPVMKVVLALANEYFEQKFRPVEDEARKTKTEERERRMCTKATIYD